MNDYKYKVTAAGRVNIIGEHVDYCGGKVFPVALTLTNTVYIRPNGTDKINIKWTTLPDEVTLDIAKLDTYKGLKYGNYQAGSALMWQRAGHEIVGCDMLQDCKIPFGSGLSSSAAIEVSTIAALATVAGEKFDLVEVALCAQKAEHEYAGVNCGIMDQYASACGRKGMAMLLDCNTLACEYVPVKLGDYTLVIANTNKPHNLVESKYNERRAETEEAFKILKGALPHISCLAEVTEEEFKEYGVLLGGKVYDRAKHVIEECDRVRQSATAMRGGAVRSLGYFLNQSHKSLKELYEVTGKELDVLAETAQKQAGCVGSRMTGAGFGGCTVSLVKKDCLEQFKFRVASEYERKIGYKPSFYETEIGDGITVTEI